ncbi:MAG TPA: hypothetical protein VHQ70_00675 [Syntrophomonadaceae bacterium]|nr:hypothetical protein [Syntrophomonadaceae bacterium]
MQLQPGEKSILAYFTTDQNAMQAVESLKSKGYTHIRLDSITRTGPRSHNHNTPYLSDLTGGDTYDRIRGWGPLMAADPAVSGLSSAESTPEVYSSMITLVTDETRLSEARESLMAYGGSVNG